MTSRTTLAVCGACAAVAAPTAAFAASGPLAAPAPLGGQTSVRAKMKADGHAPDERRTLRLARRAGKRITPRYVDRLDAMSHWEAISIQCFF